MLTLFEAGKTNIHYANAFELRDRESECGAHAANLVLLSLGNRYGELLLTHDVHFALPRHIAFDVNAFFNALFEIIGEFFVGRDMVFLFMGVFGIEEFIRNAAIVSENDETTRILVEAANGEHADKWNGLADVALVFIGGVRDDAARLVVSEIAILFCTKADIHFVGF